MSVSRRWTVADLEQIESKETERYEIIDGELIVTHAPSWRHQFPCSQLNTALEVWSGATGRGTTLQVPGLVFSEEDAVIPDIVWSSWGRLWAAEDRAGHFTLAPELVVEIVSPGAENERRDRQTKLALYSRRGVDEYWIVDWQRRTIDVYRRTTGGLELAQTLSADGILESPLLPGFRLEVTRIWPPTRQAPT
jgi:Uma2 family endonuclease